MSKMLTVKVKIMCGHKIFIALEKQKSETGCKRFRGSEEKHKSGGKEQSQLCHSHFLNILRNTSDSSGHWQRSK